MKITLATILFYCVCISCSQSYRILIYKDKSALVKTYARDTDISRYYTSDIISVLDTTYSDLEFNISNIDSIGNYIPYIQKGYFQFQLKDDLMIITDGNLDVVFDNKEWGCCHLEVTLTFNQKVEIIESINQKPKMINDSTVFFTRSKQRMEKNNKPMELLIRLK